MAILLRQTVSYSIGEEYCCSQRDAMYRGKDGQDAPGTWRIPTLREGSLIMIYYKELEATATQGTDCKAFALSDIKPNHLLVSDGKYNFFSSMVNDNLS